VTARRDHPHPLIVLACFAALSVVWTWPLVRQLSSRIAFDPGDPLLNTWILWWNSQAVPFTEEWWSPPIFYPMRGALALSEHLAGIGFFTTPLLLLGGTPALAYNIALLLSYTLSGFFTYLLVLRLTGSTPAAVCAGLAYAFAPFRAGQLSHLQVLTSQWLPLLLLGLHAFIDTGRRRWLVVFAIALVLQGLSNGYYLLFAPVLIALWIGWFAIARRQWRQVAAIAVACLIASLALLPTVLEYRSVHGALGLTRGRTEIMRFNAKPGSFLNPPRMLAFWPPRDVPTVEDFLFPGVTMTAVVIGGLGFIAWSRKRTAPHQRSTFLFYVVATVFMAALTFGPAAPDAGALGWLRPYGWLVHLPGFSGLRVPVRFAMLMALSLAVAGGLALEMILPAPRSRRLLAAMAIAVGIGIDGFMKPVGVTAPPGRVELPDVPAATVLELPPDDTTVSVGAMFRSIAHGRPLINGYSGYIPTHYGILCQSLRRNDPSAVIELARGRTLLIIISERRDRSGYFRRLIESIPGIQRGDISGAGIWYVLRAQPRDRRPYGGTAYSFTHTMLPRSQVVLDFGASRVVRSLEFTLRDRWREFGRRFAIETSTDGVTWQTVWEDWTAGPAIAGALEDQRRVPVQLVLPDVTTRYLRLHPVQDWLMDGMVVRGP
jgi:F5/8 type C domain